MKTFIFLTTLLFFTSPSYSQVWVEKDSIPAPAGFGGTFSFSIGGKLYVGGGSNGTSELTGFYQYDPSLNSWTALANVPTPVEGTYGFALNGKGYVVCGYDGANATDSVYMYNPGTNTWLGKNNFPGGARQNNACFSANGYGYIFGGLAGGAAMNDMWQYNDSTDSWRQLASCPGPGRDGPIFLVINDQIYVGMGCSTTGNPIYPDFYRFDPVANAYTAMDSMPAPRASASQFSIGNLGYVGLGRLYSSSTFLNDFYIFDPVANSWTQTDSFGGGTRAGAYSETVNGVCYVGCGITYNAKLFNDCWSYGNPSGIRSITNSTLSCYPVPATGGSFTIDMSGYTNAEKQIRIYDQVGQTVYKTISSENKILIGNKFAPGIYIVSVIQNDQTQNVRVMVE